MISLRKFIYGGSPEPLETIPVERMGRRCCDSLEAYCDALSAFGESAHKAIPAALGDLSRNLAEMNRAINCSVDEAISPCVRDRLRTELSAWSDRAVRVHEENEREIKEIMAGVTRAAETIGQRDEKFGRQIGEITARLRGIAGLNELAPIRRSIVETTTALQTCVERLADENRLAISDLSAQVEHYRARLAEVEECAALDALTGLANRRAFERQLEQFIATGKPFSLIMIDLNDFKCVNDGFGHSAGDSLLTQFATDLKAQFRVTDFVGRWGGDEFVVLMDGGITEAEARAGRIRQWALGEYTLDAGGRKVKTNVSAAIGVVEWDKREAGRQLLDRADQKLYQAKSSKIDIPNLQPV
jgi:diguanylate cyclase (GGDEF)-like protein